MLIDIIGAIVQEWKLEDSPLVPQTVKNHLASEVNELQLGGYGEKVVYANPMGFSLLGEIEDLKNNARTTEGRLRGLEAQRRGEESRQELEAAKLKVEELEGRNRELVALSEGFLKIRRRYFEVYKRDVRKSEWSPAIRNIGNDAAHEADVFIDAIMFKRDQRKDNTVFVELYGLYPLAILDYSKLSNIFRSNS